MSPASTLRGSSPLRRWHLVPLSFSTKILDLPELFSVFRGDAADAASYDDDGDDDDEDDDDDEPVGKRRRLCLPIPEDKLTLENAVASEDDDFSPLFYLDGTPRKIKEID